MVNSMRMSSNWFALLAALSFCVAASEPASRSEAPEPAAPAIPDEPAPILIKGQPRLDLSAIESLAIQDSGRKKPFQTLAHESIEQLVGRPLFGGSPRIIDEKSGVKLIAMDLYLSIWMHPKYWVDQPVLLIGYKPLVREIGFDITKKHFAPRAIATNDKFKAIMEEAQKMRHAKREKEMSDMQREAEIVNGRIDLLSRIVFTERAVGIIPHPAKADQKWLSMEGWQERLTETDKEQYYTESKMKDVYGKLETLKAAYQKQDSSAFAQASQDFRGTLAAMSPIYPAFGDLEREIGYNKLRPFGIAWVFYLLALVVGLIALKVDNKGLYYGMMAAYLAGFGIHTYGLVLRCLIAGRPPVSNMYESVIWVGLGSVVFGLIFELRTRKKFFAASGALGGFFCLVLMDLMPVVVGNAKAPGMEAPINPLVPVLRDNFWLTVHVLTMTLSYSAFMLAWVLGHITLASHLFRPGQKHEHAELHQFVYRSIQVGVLLCATGTILGGVWAYYSWGRFWGWDPKETWAFITLMCYIVALHGRFAGWWGSFGISVAAVVCFQAVVMAWYGVNFVLGNGLHSYGSGAGGEEYAIGLLVVDAIFTGLAIRKYSSYRVAGIDG